MVAGYLRGKELVYDFNHTLPSPRTKCEAPIRQLMGGAAIEPTPHVAYVSQSAIGANLNLVVVDDGKVLIAEGVLSLSRAINSEKIMLLLCCSDPISVDKNPSFH